MKYLITLTAFITFLEAQAQLTYVDVDWSIDQTVIMQNGQTDIMEFDVDGDGVNDFRITSWSNHTAGIETVIEVLLLDASLHEGLSVDQCNALVACFDGFGDPAITGYLYSSDCQNPSNEYLKFPFEFMAGNGQVHCGFLYVRYDGTTVTFEGYAWNEQSTTCLCASSGWLSIAELKLSEGYEAFEYYSLIGQRIDNPKGLVLKVYTTGRTEKVIIL